MKDKAIETKRHVLYKYVKVANIVKWYKENECK